MPSMTLDFPDPFGPTIQVNPLANFTVMVRLPKLLKPVIEIRLIAVILFYPLTPVISVSNVPFFIEYIFNFSIGVPESTWKYEDSSVVGPSPC